MGKTIENNGLENFTGWPGEGVAEEDFFAEVEETSEEDIQEEVESKTEPKPEEEEEEGQKPEDFFAQVEEEEDIQEEEEEEESTVSTTSISTLNFLKEKGFVDYELEEGEELTDELAEELIEDSIEERANEKLKSLPEKAQDIIRFALKGGNVEDYLKVVGRSVNTGINKDLDLEEESNQELVVRQTLRDAGEDEETIEAQIDFLKDSGRLQAYSEKKFEKWVANNQKAEAQLAKQVEQNRKAEKEAIKKAKEDLSVFIEKNPEVKGLKFTAEDKKILPSYVNDKSIKLQNGAQITQMQKELFYDIPQNKEAYIQLAMLMKNRNKDGTFNFKSIIKDTTTKVVKGVRENVRRSKTSIPGKSAGSKSTSKTTALADLFK